MRELADELGRSPTSAEIDARPELFASTLLASVSAPTTVGCAPPGWCRRARVDPEDVIDAFKRFQREHGRLPSSADLHSTRGTGYPPATAVQATFGDLHSARRACGYDGPPRRSRFHADDAIDALRNFHQAHGRNPSVREWHELDQRPSAPPIIRHFGSWNAALSAAGLIVTRPRQRWSNDDIITAIRAFETAHGRPPHTPDFGGPAMPSFETVRLRFGSIATAIALARTTRLPERATDSRYV